ncbi:MAG: GtrA family protein [Bacteroidota bacterium]
MSEKTNKDRLIELLSKKARFAVGGGLATGIDYLIYFTLFARDVAPAWAQVAAYSVGTIFNFLFQKFFVFEQKGSTQATFLLSMLVSVGGLGISTALIYGLNQVPFFHQYQLLTKLITTGIVFFYNFYCKRYVFERRFF